VEKLCKSQCASWFLAVVADCELREHCVMKLAYVKPVFVKREVLGQITAIACPISHPVCNPPA
jgi:hypothetical protein